MTTDVLSYLVNGKKVYDDINSCPHGSLFIVKGTLVLVESSMFELCLAAYDQYVSEELRKPKAQQDTNAITIWKGVKNLIPKISVPSCYLLHLENDVVICGTIKNSGLEEPISSYYFKHGSGGLEAVYLIAVKECGTESISSSQGFIDGSRRFAQALTELLFPPSASRATPVTMFRKLY